MRLLDFYRKWRRAPLRRLIAKGNALRDRRQWDQAAETYAEALRLDATMASIHVQYGHALKESNNRLGAYEAYRRALAIDPLSGDIWLQIGHVLKLLGRPRDAIDAYQEALMIAPGLMAAAAELIALGARDAIPDRATLTIVDAAVTTADEATRTLGRALSDVRSLMARARQSFDDFRHAYPVLPPPSVELDDATEPLSILVDGSVALAADIRCTLESLIDQTCRSWRATVTTTDIMVEHPVASMALIDQRIVFETVYLPRPATNCLRLSAGTMLDPHAIAWFRFAASLNPLAAAYCDHDHAELTWRGHRRHLEPVLQPRFDRFWFEGGHSSPALIYVPKSNANAIDDTKSNGCILCDIADRGRPVIHIPRILATIVSIDEAAATAQPDVVTAVLPVAAVCRPSVAAPMNADIMVVVPTRDQAYLLDRCVTTLIERARYPARLDIVIVDNRSVEAETDRLLARLTSHACVRTLSVDEPFNWSRANNLAICDSSAPLLVMLNNDTEMLTDEWDVLLAQHLARPKVGIVGARLLYPDRTVQHAGILFGMNDTPPIHDGIGADESDPGPDGRWIRPRAAAAVTGAFMAMTRETWAATGGFDEWSFPISLNDVDMCLRVRALDMTILYAPDLLLIHHESKTRGHTVTRSQVAWDRTELRAFHKRWGEAMFDDPSLNPQWVRHGIPFSGYREPPASEVVRYLQGQAGSGSDLFALAHQPAH